MTTASGKTGSGLAPDFLLCCLVLVIGPLGCATPPPPPSPPPLLEKSAGISHEVLPSGMQLVVREDTGAEQVTLNVSYRVGASDEPVGKEGLAELAALLTTGSRPKGEGTPPLAEWLAALGAKSRYSTTYDETEFWSDLPPAHIARWVELEAQWMRAPLAHLTGADFLRVRTQAVEHLRQSLEASSDGVEARWLYEKTLPGHAYGRPRFGTPESLARLTWEDVQAFVKEKYTPAHVVLVVSGPLPMVDVKFVVARGFAGLTGAASANRTPVSRTPPPFPEELPDGTPVAVVHGPVQTPRLHMVLTVPGLYSGQLNDALIAAEGLDAWVRRKLEGDKRVQAIRTTYQEMDGVTLLICSLELRQDLQRGEQAQEVAATALDSLPLVFSLITKGDTYAVSGDRLLDVRDYMGTRWYKALNQLILSRLHKQMKEAPAADIARILRATGRADAFRVREQQARQANTSQAMYSYDSKYLRPERARLMLVVPDPGR